MGEGTAKLTRDMGVLFANYKHSGGTRDKLGKRAEETEVLKLYERQGQNYCATVKAWRQAAQAGDETEKGAPPPPYDRHRSGFPSSKNTDGGETSRAYPQTKKRFGKNDVPVRGAYSHVKGLLEEDERITEREPVGAYHHVKELLREAERSASCCGERETPTFHKGEQELLSLNQQIKKQSQ